MRHPRVLSMPDPEIWVTLHQAADLLGYSYHHVRNELFRREDAPACVVYKGRIYLRRDQVLAAWGGPGFATAEEAISSQAR